VPISSKDADFHLVDFKGKTKKLPIEFFSQVSMISSKNLLTPTQITILHEVQTQKCTNF